MAGCCPSGAATGTVLRADAEFELDGITILSVTDPKAKSSKSGLLELIPSDAPFEAVTQQLARRERGDRPRNDRGDRGDRPRGDRPRGDRPGGSDRPRGDRPGGDRPSGDRPSGDRRPRPEGDAARGPRPERRGRPNFTPPPELPQRPKAKRLKPGRAHRNAVLAELPEEQRAVAERALQGGVPAVRQAVTEQNARLKAEGKDEIPAAGLVAMAEQLLPKLRVAEWLDRADAAKADIDELDLRDLRSVVAAGDDPMVARDETTRVIAEELKQALVTKQEKELQLWFGDIDAAIGVGRIIRALKLSSQPPKAGVRFPSELAKRLSDAATASLTPDALQRPLGRRARSRGVLARARTGDARRGTAERQRRAARHRRSPQLAVAADRRAVRCRGEAGRLGAEAAAPHQARCQARRQERAPKPPAPKPAPKAESPTPPSPPTRRRGRRAPSSPSRHSAVEPAVELAAEPDATPVDRASPNPRSRRSSRPPRPRQPPWSPRPKPPQSNSMWSPRPSEAPVADADAEPVASDTAD